MRVQCPECKGIGLISYIYNEEEVNGACTVTPVYDFEVCENCQGKGYWEVYEYE